MFLFQSFPTALKSEQANPPPGIVKEEGVEESDEEVKDTQLVHLTTDLVLNAEIL